VLVPRQCFCWIEEEGVFPLNCGLHCGNQEDFALSPCSGRNHHYVLSLVCMLYPLCLVPIEMGNSPPGKYIFDYGGKGVICILRFPRGLDFFYRVVFFKHNNQQE